ncbi:uncharacterized protein LOC110456471 [Mizuhopecten yessoensis]|uniref:Histone-lysine N-methyltransferase ASHR1 n=1 Tax=Mizuhopecten yessoensis TaxID=6573 RepID=A0A210QAX3_MIZYE|nr:uncharacterized protein LOC110456471 [Mizuhopecten yessoensis]OWF45865.1 Histone-lysine N-methyltransferase ASHR1 [Mizuhopecten yessoensis]
MDFTKHPFGLPASNPKANIVNTILKENYLCQKENRISNACGIVSIVLKLCFDAVDVPVSIKYGILKFINKMRLPHVWLDFQGHILDNTFMVYQDEDTFIKIKTMGVCEYEEGTGNTEHLFLGDQDNRRLGIPDHNKNEFQVLLKRPESTMTIAVRNMPHIGAYYHRMREIMDRQFKVSIKNFFDRSADTKCWACDGEKPTEELKKCSVCKVACYCDKTCQKKDWKEHKHVCWKPESA